MPSEFNILLDDDHRYTVDGAPAPGVSEILADVGLVDYSKLPPATREEALNRGSQVHDAICFWLQNDLDIESVPEEYRGYLDAATAFSQDVDLKPHNIETKGYHPDLRYCGRLDCEGEMTIPKLGRRRCLIDWKTGTAQPWTRIQTAAYALFFESPATRYRICVELHKDGTYKLFIMPPTQFMEDVNRWKAAVTTYYSKREVKW